MAEEKFRQEMSHNAQRFAQQQAIEDAKAAASILRNAIQ